MSSTHLLPRAQGHASYVSRSSSSTANHSLSGSSPKLFPAFGPTSSSDARLLAATGCGASGSIADQTGFEDADGNLKVDTASCTDWNSFHPTWTGTAPFQTGTATLGGLSFVGLTDAVNSTSDNIYAGGVKQDTVCPGTTTGKPNDKADLARIYVATETINGQVYLFLAWERQIDTTVQSDVFVSFEFDQGQLSCGAGSPFVQRTQGDLLFDYNFQSGSSTIDAQEWDGSTWQPLPTPPFAAAVNSPTVTDTIGPNGSVDLTQFEFGEAGINLSALNLSGNGGKACETFGSVLGGSRTSKSGDTAQLKDFVGPAPIDVSNCVSPTVDTTLHNAKDDSTIANGSSIPLGSSVYDTASFEASSLITGKDPTGTFNFTFFDNGTCSGDGTPAGTGVALNGQSDTEGPLAAGDYSFEAQYIAGNDPNYSDSAPSACEPLTINQGSLTPSTTIKNAADNSTVTGALPLGSSVYDTTSVSGAVQGFAPTGTIEYRFFSSVDCSTGGSSAGSGKALNGQSNTEGPLGSGSYSFDARYDAGANDNYPTSDWSSCEPLTISPGSLTASTTIKNAADDSEVKGALPLGSSVYDTTQLTGLIQGEPATGSIQYRFFTSGDCSTGASSAGDSVALGDPSNTEGPLASGSYSFDSRYVAGQNDNYPTSDWSSCEPLTINQGSLTASTTIKNAADDSTVDGPLPLGSSVYDTTQLSGQVEGFDPTGTISYRFFQNGDCSGDGTSAGTGVPVDGQSDTEGPLSTGSYSFDARYVAGENDNYPTSDWSACEPLAIGAVTPSASTTLKNAATDATIPNGSTLPHGSSVYDTASITATDDFPLTGTVTFRFFHNGTCSGDPASAQTDVAVGSHSDATGPLDAGSYAFDAMYVAGDDPNHTNSDWSACEPFTIAPAIDLAITKVGSPASQTLGDGNITWTMVVTNNGPDAATGVTIADPMPAGNTFVSATTTQGSCTGGAILSCSLGTIAAGGTVTITLVTTPSTVGDQTNTVTVVGNETETNTANNTATATVRTVGVITPPVFCVAVSKVTPKQLFVGRKTMLTIHVTQQGKAVKGIHVKIKGPKLNVRTQASNGKGIIKRSVKLKKAGIVIFSPIASKRCNTKRIGVTNVFTPPVTG